MRARRADRASCATRSSARVDRRRVRERSSRVGSDAQDARRDAAIASTSSRRPSRSCCRRRAKTSQPGRFAMIDPEARRRARGRHDRARRLARSRAHRGPARHLRRDRRAPEATRRPARAIRAHQGSAPARRDRSRDARARPAVRGARPAPARHARRRARPVRARASARRRNKARRACDEVAHARPRGQDGEPRSQARGVSQQQASARRARSRIRSHSCAATSSPTSRRSSTR